jgi:type IV pilus assembly protein PilV
MMRLPSRMVRSARQRGMTLIEILVAIVVLSIGLLGLAGLQLKGLQVGQGSIYRWQAAMLAEDMADRIPADPVGAQAGSYAYTGGTPTATGATGQAITDWLARVAALPGGAAIITEPPGLSPQLLTVTISWQDVRAQIGSGQVAPGANPPATSTQGSFSLVTER